MRPNVCPRCASRFPDIKGVVYPAGNANESFKCDDEWHFFKGDPEILVLTPEDIKLLKGMAISAQ